MPPKAKTEQPPLGPAPASTGELCNECESRDLDPSTTHMSCPHGTWMFAPGEPEAQPVAEDVRAAILAELDAETLSALLAEKTAEPAK